MQPCELSARPRGGSFKQLRQKIGAVYGNPEPTTCDIENLGEREGEARASAKAMIDRALLRVARTSRKWTRWGAPCAHGAPDTGCEICGSPCEPQE